MEFIDDNLTPKQAAPIHKTCQNLSADCPAAKPAFSNPAVLWHTIQVTSIAIERSEAAILSRLIRPEKGGLNREAADSILAISFPAADMERMNALAERARQGELSAEEEVELENYRHVGRLLEVLKSKARQSIKALPRAA